MHTYPVTRAVLKAVQQVSVLCVLPETKQEIAYAFAPPVAHLHPGVLRQRLTVGILTK